MSRSRARSGMPSEQKVPRIRPGQAGPILEQCRRVLDSSRDLLANLPTAGLSALLARLDDKALQLAVQPDAWGERTRALLMSELAPALGRHSHKESAVSIEDIVQVANVVVPCLLLEIGRRKQHIQIEFPTNPTDPGSCFTFRAGASYPVHSLSSDGLVKLVTVAGEALVGLCYFGDQESRGQVEAVVSLNNNPAPQA